MLHPQPLADLDRPDESWKRLLPGAADEVLWPFLLKAWTRRGKMVKKFQGVETKSFTGRRRTVQFISRLYTLYDPRQSSSLPTSFFMQAQRYMRFYLEHLLPYLDKTLGIHRSRET